MGEMYGYAGKILLINLTEKTTEIIPTSKYAPKYLGGREMANRLFFDLMKDEWVPALDPRNISIFMTGCCAATGLPIAGRAVMTGISAKGIPEMYVHSGLGGFFGGMLKWAGYDGFAIVGKADEHTHILIKDDKVEFLNADWLWGQFVTDTQKSIMDKYGAEYYSLVIGPAGENLHRHASVVTNGDSAAAKSGFGAVWGSKNLKAVTVYGTGTISVPDVNKVLELRNGPGNPTYAPNPIKNVTQQGGAWGCEKPIPVEPFMSGAICCNHGCNNPCMGTQFDISSIMPEDGDEKISISGKCVDGVLGCRNYDSHDILGASVFSHYQSRRGTYHWMCPTVPDKDGPHADLLMEKYPGDWMGLGKFNPMLSKHINWLNNQYGIDKWDFIVWYHSWLSMCKKEGLLDDLDFGYEIDVDSEECLHRFVDEMVYRKGKLGDLFAEGMGRAIRKLGIEKYGNSIYHGRKSGIDGRQLDIPVSLESAWGDSSHWQGRGFQGCHKYLWVAYSLLDMIGSRDEASGQHIRMWVEQYERVKDDPCHKPELMEISFESNCTNMLKDSIGICEYKYPDPGRNDMEVDLYEAATGILVDRKELLHCANRGVLVARAIQMKYFGRTRDMEVENVYPYLTYPDPAGEVVTWDEWNDAVDLFYDMYGFDRKTGWPFRRTWERYGLKDIADQMEKLGKLPADDNSRDYVRKPNPFNR